MVQRLRRILDPIAAAAAAAAATASPLERNTQLCSKGWRERDSDGIGLAIAAALEKSARDAAAPNLRVSAPIAPPRVTAAAATTARIEREDGSTVTCHGGSMRCRDTGIFCASPTGRSEVITAAAAAAAFPIADFLSRCFSCRKRLDGRDIYMYGGEKAFCSGECCHRQIVADDFQDRCCSHVPKPDVAASGSGDGRLFFIGVVST